MTANVNTRRLKNEINQKNQTSNCGNASSVTDSLASHLTMLKYSPSRTQVPTKSYNAGLSLSMGTDGVNCSISANVDVTTKALYVNTYSSKSDNLFKTCYDYKQGNKAFNEYCYYENEQLMSYALKTAQSSYSNCITIKPKFELYKSIPKDNATSWGPHGYDSKQYTINAFKKLKKF